MRAEMGQYRIAAVGDLHIGEKSRGVFKERLARVNHDADVLVLCGDLTNVGTVAEASMLIEELSGVSIPIIAVLGNHDYESGLEETIRKMLCERGVEVLDGSAPYEYNGELGFAGVKGFCGGYGRGTLSSFGEPAIKGFVKEALDETMKLEVALRKLPSAARVVIMHYSPVVETVQGEPFEIFPYLGCSRLAEPLDYFDVSVCFHGHAHQGSFAGRTLGGVPVYNVALPVLQRRDPGAMYYVHTVAVAGAKAAPAIVEGAEASAPKSKVMEEGSEQIG